MAEFDVFEQDNIVIHGSVNLARSQGYSGAVGVENFDGGAYSSYASGHYNGTPAFCMYVKLENFKRNPDFSVQCTITRAFLDKFPASGSHYFGYGFEMYAAFYIGDLPASSSQWDSSKIKGKTWLFWKRGSGKSGGPRQWSRGYCEVNNVTITAPNPSNEKVYFLLFNQSYCTCNQAYNDRPVFIANLEAYIPSINPYVWQMQGTEQNKAWHLIRPFYIVRQYNGQKYWFSIEDAENPVYNMDGTPYIGS